jgi:hypothetical protein
MLVDYGEQKVKLKIRQQISDLITSCSNIVSLIMKPSVCYKNVNTKQLTVIHLRSILHKYIGVTKLFIFKCK